MLVRRKAIPIVHLLLYGWMPGPLKKAVYRMKGYKIGRNVSFGLGAVIKGDSVVIGDECKIGMLTMIQGRSIEIGPRVRFGMMTAVDCPVVKVGEGTRINNQVVIGGMQSPDSAFTIGRNCILMEWSFVNTTLPIVIGDDVGIGGHCLFFTHGMWPNTFEGFPAKYAPITIEDQAWLAWRVCVLPGVTIGSRSIISSDACVVRDIPTGTLAAGVPAKAIQENERYVQDVDSVGNAARLRDLLNELQRWLDFNGIQSNWVDEHRLAIRSAGAGDVLVLDDQNFDAALAGHQALSRVACAVSVLPLSQEHRNLLESFDCAWIDVPAKKRSVVSNKAVDEVEEYLHRGGAFAC